MMRFDRKIMMGTADRIVNLITVIAVTITFLILQFRVLTHFPFFDETIHAHYLWMFSQGLRPGVDFFCTYPILGYLTTLPFFSMFPDSAFIILALRSISVVLIMLIGAIFFIHGKRASHDWAAGLLSFILVVKAASVGTYFAEYSIDHFAALAAFAAFLLMFTEPRIKSLVLITSLCVVSVAFTPKYPLPLFFGLSGYVAAYYLRYRKAGAAIAVVSSVGIATVAGLALLFSLNGVSLAENFQHAVMTNLRWSLSHDAFGFQQKGQPLILVIGEFLVDNPTFTVIILLGIAGWVKRSWRNPDVVALSGAGILAGSLLASLMIKNYSAQYVAPRTLCLAWFAPYIFSLVRSQQGTFGLRIFLTVATVTTLFLRLNTVAQRFEVTPFTVRGVTSTTKRVSGTVAMAPTGLLMLSDYDELLDKIPENERVVAVWPCHPIFRRDQTVITFDEQPSFSNALADDDVYKKTFDPKIFRDSLEKEPPAMICTFRLELNYPPGWQKEVEDFLSSHADQYLPGQTRMIDYWIRRDLSRI